MDYYANVLADLRATGRVEFFANTNYVGEDADGHHLESLLSGAATVVRARTFVDATYVESTIPSRHTPSFVVEEGVRLVTPNALADLAEPVNGFTVLGAGKTAMDSINWLLDGGVDPDRIRWVKPSEALLIDRAATQPLDLVAGSLRMQADWVVRGGGHRRGVRGDDARARINVAGRGASCARRVARRDREPTRTRRIAQR